MNFRVVVGLAAIWIALHLSCDTVNDPCGGPFPTHFDVQAYSVFLSEPTFGASALDTTQAYSYDSMAIRVFPVVEYLYTKASRQGHFGVQAAYACTPPIPYSVDTLLQLSVITDDDYDSTFMAGDTLDPILVVSFLDEKTGPQEMSVSDFLSSRPSVKRDMYLQFSVPPAQQAQYRFTMYVKHFSGEEFQYVTTSVTIKP
jgi:hypothetical protein